jgi:hypothetical protein
MKILTQLNHPVVTDGDWKEPRGIISTVCDEPVKGFFRKVELGEAGVTVRRGGVAVGIPLAEIIKLAVQAEPKLLPPNPAKPA